MHNTMITTTKKITDIIIISVVTTTYITKVIHASFCNGGHKRDNNEREMNQTTQERCDLEIYVNQFTQKFY